MLKASKWLMAASCYLIPALPVAGATGSIDYAVTLCDACDAAQFSRAALEKGDVAQGLVYVVDRVRDSVSTYKVTGESSSGRYGLRAERRSGEVTVQEQIRQALAAYHAVNGYRTVDARVLRLPAQPSIDSAGDLPGSHYRQQVVANAVAGYARDHVWKAVLSLEGEVDPRIVDTIFENLDSGIAVRFPDGSQSRFKAAAATATPQGLEYQYQFVSR